MMLRVLFTVIKSLLILEFHSEKVDKKTRNIFFESIISGSRILLKEKTENFDTSNLQYIRRNSIVWVDFGFNAGHEFGGRHPAVVLKYINNGEDVYVIPIDGHPLPIKKRKLDGSPKAGCVEIPVSDSQGSIIFNMEGRDRWCDVRRLRCISWLLIDFKNVGAYMRKDFVDKIEQEVLRNAYVPMRK